MEEANRNWNPASIFTDDILVDILSRLPVRCVCRFKCVSRSWRDLISHPDHRKKLPQTLTGFFYEGKCIDRFPAMARYFANVTGKGAPFIFPSTSNVTLLDSCGGLLLFCCSQPGPRDRFLLRSFTPGPPFNYVVCNPATGKWVRLLNGSGTRASGEARTARLCFDSIVSPHFHVVEYVVDDDHITRLEIYSSETGSWSPRETEREYEWEPYPILCIGRRSVFLNGFLHSLVISNVILAVDMDGRTWRKILVPRICLDECGFIGRAQGHLCFINVNADDRFKLSVWTLEDYANDDDEWILKHTVSTLDLFGGKRIQFDLDYEVIAIHPEGNMIFFLCGREKTLMTYIMDSREVRVIRNLGHGCVRPYLPYVPLFSEAPLDRQ